MKTTTLILSAIIATLPFRTWAEQTTVYTNTPVAVGANGTIKIAQAPGPYATNEPTVDDQTHIATTAYVKGAYNDAIAAVNSTDSRLSKKQNQLRNVNLNVDISKEVLGRWSAIDILSAVDDGTIVQQDWDELETLLISTTGVITAIKSQRAEIYTTWGVDDGTATTLVPFVTAQQ